ncbi:GIY-YIG nuclease family protein [Hydrogenophaga sp.]|uniref:GIY-YIG nuclease family protein n=1 Tax=Hydrogenophaga sp. TaxID=1904254 RepID=UPI0035AF314F
MQESTYTPQVAVYALCCPTDGSVKYIGKAVDPKKRYQQHLREKRGNTPKVNWVQKCLRNGFVPTLVVLEWVDAKVWKAAEKRWISEYRANGGLLNVADGGDEPHCPTEVRASNGKKTAHAIHTNPVRKRMWELKRSLGSALKDGVVSEATKEKMRRAAVRFPQFYSEWASI